MADEENKNLIEIQKIISECGGKVGTLYDEGKVLSSIKFEYLDLKKLKLAENGVLQDLLQYNESCTTMDIEYCDEISSEWLNYFKHFDFQTIYINYTKMADETLSVFQNFKNLTKINLKDCGITGEGLKYLSNLNQLEDITLWFLKDFDCNNLKAFSNTTSLQKISFMNTPIDLTHRHGRSDVCATDLSPAQRHTA